MAETILIDWGKKNKVNVTILRLPLVVGPDPPGNLGAIIRAIKKGYYFRIGDGSARRSLVLAEDVANIIENIIEDSGVYNLTDGYHPEFKEIELCIAEQLEKKYIPTIPNILASTIAKCGDHIPLIPLNSDRLVKMTSTLTFSDKKARNNIGWAPKSVLNNFKIQ